jgi:hypothetical protein
MMESLKFSSAHSQYMLVVHTFNRLGSAADIYNKRKL